MLGRDSFYTREASAKLQELKGRFQYPVSGVVTEVNDILEQVIFALHSYTKAPKFVITRALYDDGNGVLRSARFVVRLSVREQHKVGGVKKVLSLTAGAAFFDTFIQEMADWFDLYEHNLALAHNVSELNKIVAGVVTDRNNSFQLEFAVGEGLVDLSDNHVVVGLSENTVMKLGQLPLSDTNADYKRMPYKEKIADLLVQCLKPFDIVKVKTQVTKDLDIYSRKGRSKIIRATVNRSIDHTRVGVGYFDFNNIFAVVEKTAVTPEEAATFGADVVVIENAGASAVEKRNLKTKIAVRFKVSPFNKDTGMSESISLVDILKTEG